MTTNKKITVTRTMLAASAGAAALLAAGGAFAQDATTVEELIVTAEKREMNIQEVPAAVSAISGENLLDRGSLQLEDYSKYLPGVSISSTGSPGQTNVTIRGIAAVGPGSVVGYYLNDTPIGSSSNFARATEFALDLLPYDLERLELLRGPQGTLYGAGTMGGLVKYVLKEADTDGFSADAGAQLMSTKHSGELGYGVRAAVNAPLGDRLAIRASAYDQQTRGFTDNVLLGLEGVDDVEQYGGRLAATWTPTDNLKVNLNAMWHRVDSDDNASVNLYAITTTPEPGGGLIFNGSPTLGAYAQSHPFQQPFKKNIDYYSGTVNLDLGMAEVVSATSWSRTTTHQFQDASIQFGSYTALFGMNPGVGTFDLSLELEKFTQEFRLVSPEGGRVEWMLGAFYTREDSVNEQTALVFDENYQPITGPLAPFFSPYFAFANLPTTYKEMAVFGNLTWNISDQFDVTGGLRYARNDQTFTQISDGLILGGFVQQPGESSEGVTTWMVNARYRFNDDVMAYARVATGYRPGGPNVALAGSDPTVDSDTLISYEAGIKSTWLDGRLLLNATVFNIDWTGIQLTVFNATRTATYLENAGDAFSRGFEVEGFFVPVDGLRLGFNAAYTNAELTEVAAGAPPFILGYQLPGVPKWTTGLTADYEWAAFGDWRANVGAGVAYQDEMYNAALTTPGYDADTKDPSYTTLDLRAGLTNGRWKVNVWVNNATDELVYRNGFVVLNPVSGVFDTIDVNPLRPRTFGISFDASF